MCGRFTLRTPLNQLVAQFVLQSVEQAPDGPHYNIAPTQAVAVVRAKDQPVQRYLAMLRWGLIPSWAKDSTIGSRLINARSETIVDKPSFRHSMRYRRCLILADGYYEWQAHGRNATKQPYYICMQDRRPFAFAGLWCVWQNKQDVSVESCTVITTNANHLTRAIHDRMPVILGPDAYDRWLAPNVTDADSVLPLLGPHRSSDMVIIPVGTLVNNPRNDVPQCIAPQGDGPTG